MTSRCRPSQPVKAPIRLAFVLIACGSALGAARADPAPAARPPTPAGTVPLPAPPPKPAPAPRATPAFFAITQAEALKAGLPADLVDAVIKVESDYVPTRIGGVGEIGLMQVRPGTAAMLGFHGSDDELAKPEINIHYGAAYLGEALRRAKGDICRALMKYRAGHGEETMTPLSILYCRRARDHLAAVGSTLATTMTVPDLPPGLAPASPRLIPASLPGAKRPRAPLHGAAFWAAHDARVKRITATLESRWRRLALR